MRVRSRLSERLKSPQYAGFGKSAKTSPATSCLSSLRRQLALFGFERFILTGKRAQLPFLPQPRAGDYDTRYRLPTRQMGWPTLGCNQQDPWRASERLVNCKPARMVPKRLPGGELQIRHIKIHYFIQIAVDGESVRRRKSAPH